MGSRDDRTARQKAPPPKPRELESWSVRVRVRLIRKFADAIDGIDLSHCAAGDLIEVPRYEAELLMAEGWAEAVTEHLRLVPKTKTRGRREFAGLGARVTDTADAQPQTLDTTERLCEISRQVGLNSFGPLERRRIEDRIREELRDSRARTIHK